MDSITNGLRSYISQVQNQLSQGLSPEPPETLEQLDWLVDEYPEYAKPFLPPSAVMHQLGKHSMYGRLKELPELFRERFLLTLLNEPQFAVAIRKVLRMEDDR